MSYFKTLKKIAIFTYKDKDRSLPSIDKIASYAGNIFLPFLWKLIKKEKWFFKNRHYKLGDKLIL